MQIYTDGGDGRQGASSMEDKLDQFIVYGAELLGLFIMGLI